MKKRYWYSIMLAVVTLIFTPVILKQLNNLKKYEQFKNMPEPEFPVTIVNIANSQWLPTIKVIGFIEPNQGVTLATQVSGVINYINFESGNTIKHNDILVTLDSKVERANLKSVVARLVAAKTKLERYHNLYKQGSISKEALDEVEAKFYSLKADIESLNAEIDRRLITAPFDGVVGLRNVFMGQYLQAGSNIVRLEDTSVMKLRFTVPQTEIANITLGQQVDISVDAYPESPFSGQISAIEPSVNAQSGVIQIQADIPNNEGQLRAGMFARAKIILPIMVDQIVVEQTAINFTLYGENVYVLREQNGGIRAFQKVVKIGEREGHVAHVLDGLNIGDKIVTSGQVRLSNGDKVRIVKSDLLTLPIELPQL
ncbi:efflux RND transporter periplasmic adaptor subunit [Candidatus Enterovibrio escicola]|uniref:Putative Co/Zn/Cd efflux system membrane fusion protein n=2 Tax=Candidatus Enterovibrio escicola TaxID=1927127 RepID=A0A2A5T0D7_9GAMM|nr:efflux RND transporter periplasmic adaptor subunit [Candidatus Enterovibrio escacola]PCS21623.1 putative Co/Zn/Cd efflux system membrane fusion protein [Candidatus Enterovibrio escacola]